MRVATIKLRHDGKSHSLRTATIGSGSGRYEGFDGLKERATNAVILTLVAAAVVVLCAVMGIGFYRWSRYALIFAPDGAAGPAITYPLE